MLKLLKLRHVSDLKTWKTLRWVTTIELKKNWERIENELKNNWSGKYKSKEKIEIIVQLENGKKVQRENGNKSPKRKGK